MTRTTPRRRMILQFSQIRLTEDRTFMFSSAPGAKDPAVLAAPRNRHGKDVVANADIAEIVVTDTSGAGHRS